MTVGTSTNKFIAEEFYYNRNYCEETFFFDIIQINSEDDTYLLIDAPVYENDVLVVRPNSDNINIDDVRYRFKVYVYNLDGKNKTSMTYILSVGCPSTSY